MTQPSRCYFFFFFLRPSSIIIFFSLCSDFFFLRLLDGRICLIGLCASCTKRNLMRLINERHPRTQSLTTVYRAASSFNYKLPTRRRENTHSNTHAQTEE